jgi:hypothetical protein
MTVSTLDREPVQFADLSAILADDSDDYAVAGSGNWYEDMATADANSGAESMVE